MRSIIHISDLHFGKIDERLLQPLLTAINTIDPHVVVVSGDITQRARRGEYRAAQQFLQNIKQPMLVVPGNHDVPLYNFLARLLFPLRNYKKYISRDLSPFYRDEEMAITCVSTPRKTSIINGRISKKQLREVEHRLQGVAPGVARIVVSHHPFDFAEHMHKYLLVRRARLAMETFSRLGIDMFLAGHFHRAHIGDTTKRYKIENYAALVVQAGSTTSTRQRKRELPSFNKITIDGERIQVCRYEWHEKKSEYCLALSEHFIKKPGGWVRGG